jgi:hypothetical protein
MSAGQTSTPGELADRADRSIKAWFDEALDPGTDLDRVLFLLESCQRAALVSVLLGQRQEQLDSQ